MGKASPVLFLSSLLMALPTAFAWKRGQRSVAAAAALCVATSLANHGTGLPELRALDLIVVNAVGAYYTLRALAGWRQSVWHRVTVACALAALALYLAAPAGDAGHVAVHAVAALGICAYIRAGAKPPPLNPTPIA